MFDLRLLQPVRIVYYGGRTWGHALLYPLSFQKRSILASGHETGTADLVIGSFQLLRMPGLLQLLSLCLNLHESRRNLPLE